PPRKDQVHKNAALVGPIALRFRGSALGTWTFRLGTWDLRMTATLSLFRASHHSCQHPCEREPESILKAYVKDPVFSTTPHIGLEKRTTARKGRCDTLG